MLVLGVDPGSRVTGYGLVKKTTDRIDYIHAGTISPPKNAPLHRRIYTIFHSMVEIIDTYHPQEMSIEDVFVAKNVKSSLKLGHARGAVMIAAVQFGIEVFEYSPLEIKKAVVGYGRATKEQVRDMVKVLLNLKTQLGMDASDALASAICHLNWTRYDQRQ